MHANVAICPVTGLHYICLASHIVHAHNLWTGHLDIIIIGTHIIQLDTVEPL